MKLFEINYKGKWHIYADYKDEMFGTNGTVLSAGITQEELLAHAYACKHYGIPMYTGTNKNFRARCDRAEKMYQDDTRKYLKDMRKQDTMSRATQRL